MSIFEILLTAVGLSMDAFAVSACAGLTMPKATLKKAAVVGLYFGVFQAAMPLIGYFIATWFKDEVVAFDHWIAFVLLGFLGGRMILESFKKEGCTDRACPADGGCSDRECPNGKQAERIEASLKPSKMLPLAIATSIDALAVGVMFATLDEIQGGIALAVSLIGATTFTLSMLGVKVGNVFGTKLKSKAELAGGIILVLIGVKILLNGLGVINF
jgi:putative Mn2+ efflux pump MntP